MRDHLVEVHSFTARSPKRYAGGRRRLHQARCLCGWSGPRRVLIGEASDDAAMHRLVARYGGAGSGRGGDGRTERAVRASTDGAARPASPPDAATGRRTG